MTEQNHPEESLSVNQASDVRTLAKGGALQIAGQIAGRALAFVFVAVAVRILGTAGYGRYRQISQILNLAGMVAPGGFNYAAVRFMTRARALGDHPGVRGAARVTLLGALAVSSIEFVVLLIAGESIAGWFADSPSTTDDLAHLLRLGAAFAPLYAGMQVLRYCTLAYKTNVPSIVSGNIVMPFVRSIVGAIVVILGFGLAGAILSLAASAAIGMLVAFWYYQRMLTEPERLARPRYDVGPIVRFAMPQAGVGIFSVQSLGVGVVILGLVASDREVGLFGIALSIQGAGGVFLTGVSSIWAPVVTDLYERGEINRLGSLYQIINRWIATFSFPIFAALILEPDLVVGLLAGSDASDAAPLVAILAIGNLFFVGTGPSSHVLSMTGRPGINLVNSVVAVVLYATLGYAAAGPYGAIGVAIVDVIVTILVNAARVVEAKMLVGIQPFGRSFLKPVVATVAAGVVVFAWGLFADDARVLELVGLAIGGIVYLVALRVMGVDVEERHVYDRIKARLPWSSRK